MVTICHHFCYWIQSSFCNLTLCLQSFWLLCSRYFSAFLIIFLGVVAIHRPLISADMATTMLSLQHYQIFFQDTKTSYYFPVISWGCFDITKKSILAFKMLLYFSKKYTCVYVFLIIFPLEFSLPLTSVLLLCISSFSDGLFSVSSADFSSSSYLLNIAVSQDSFLKMGFLLSILNSSRILSIPRLSCIIS